MFSLQFPPSNTKKYLDKIVEAWSRLENIGTDWIGPFHCAIKIANPDYVKLVLANISKFIFSK